MPYDRISEQATYRKWWFAFAGEIEDFAHPASPENTACYSYSVLHRSLGNKWNKYRKLFEGFATTSTTTYTRDGLLRKSWKHLTTANCNQGNEKGRWRPEHQEQDMEGGAGPLRKEEWRGDTCFRGNNWEKNGIHTVFHGFNWFSNGVHRYSSGFNRFCYGVHRFVHVSIDFPMCLIDFFIHNMHLVNHRVGRGCYHSVGLKYV